MQFFGEHRTYEFPFLLYICRLLDVIQLQENVNPFIKQIFDVYIIVGKPA